MLSVENKIDNDYGSNNIEKMTDNNFDSNNIEKITDNSVTIVIDINWVVSGFDLKNMVGS